MLTTRSCSSTERTSALQLSQSELLKTSAFKKIQNFASNKGTYSRNTCPILSKLLSSNSLKRIFSSLLVTLLSKTLMPSLVKQLSRSSLSTMLYSSCQSTLNLWCCCLSLTCSCLRAWFCCLLTKLIPCCPRLLSSSLKKFARPQRALFGI